MTCRLDLAGMSERFSPHARSGSAPLLMLGPGLEVRPRTSAGDGEFASVLLAGS